MATAVEELLDMLYEMIDEAKNMPLSSEKCVIERDKALDLLDDIKAQFPVEVGEAKKLLSARADYIASAKREAELIRKQAEEQARQIVAEDGLVAQAKQKSTEMVQTAEDRSRELRRAANDYCEDALRRTEEAVAEAYDEIKRSRAKFRAAAGASASQSAAPSRMVYDAAADED
jgi:F0F1-type ATP synthase membrane subunit b/b'